MGGDENVYEMMMMMMKMMMTIMPRMAAMIRLVMTKFVR